MSTTAKFSLDNPLYKWPSNPELDVSILLNRLNDLRASLTNQSLWKSELILDPNNLLRKIESKEISIVFVCLNDLKYSVHVAHLPFLCRLNGTKLVVLKAGAAKELHSFFGKQSLFMFGMTQHPEIKGFTDNYPPAEALPYEILPQMNIKN